MAVLKNEVKSFIVQALACFDPAKDQCSRTMTGCKLRFGPFAELPFGGFPGIARVPRL